MLPSVSTFKKNLAVLPVIIPVRKKPFNIHTRGIGVLFVSDAGELQNKSK